MKTKRIVVVKDFTRDNIAYKGTYINGLVNAYFEVDKPDHMQAFENHLNALKSVGYEIEED